MVRDLLLFSLIVYRLWASVRMSQLDGWFQVRGFLSLVFLVLVVVAVLLRYGMPLPLILRRFLLVQLILMFISLLLMLSSLLIQMIRGDLGSES